MPLVFRAIGYMSPKKLSLFKSIHHLASKWIKTYFVVCFQKYARRILFAIEWQSWELQWAIAWLNIYHLTAYGVLKLVENTARPSAFKSASTTLLGWFSVVFVFRNFLIYIRAWQRYSIRFNSTRDWIFGKIPKVVQDLQNWFTRNSEATRRTKIKMSLL